MINEANESSAEQRFLNLDDDMPPELQLPPEMSFVKVRHAGSQVWLSGHSPSRRERPPKFDYVGKVGSDLDIDQGRAAARLVGLNMLVTLRAAVGSLDRVDYLLQMMVFVNSAPGFIMQAPVANACSDLMVDVFGEAGEPARMVAGMSELPFNMAVQASLVAQLKS